MSAAESWARNGMCMNLNGEANAMIEKIELCNPDGMILGFFDFDRWLGAQQKIIAKIGAGAHRRALLLHRGRLLG